MKNGWLTTLCLAFALTVALRADAAAVDVVMRTELGDIAVELYPDRAPRTVANFLSYVDERAYDGSSFFRVVRPDNQHQDQVQIEVIQGGDLAERSCRPPIPLERTSETGLSHCDGAISMARGAPDSAQASFFICIGRQPQLDFGGRRNPDGQGFAAFGRVIHGMEVVRAVQRRPAEGQTLVEPVSILSIRRK